MFPSMQPSRPRLPPAHPIPPPMNQQPSRNLTSLPSSPPTFTSPPAPGPIYEAPRATRPRNQMDAMPPFAPQHIIPAPVPGPAPARTIFDASRRHPVFFTDRLKRAPAGVGTGGGTWMSPVSQGYVFNDGVRRKVEGEVKL